MVKEAPTTDIKVVLGFCRSKDLKTLKRSNEFYYHASESNNTIKDFPSGILDATRLLIYSGGRSKPLKLTGLYSEIKAIELKHKSKIKGKENSQTEFYFKVILTDKFKKSDELKFVINSKKLIEILDDKNRKLLQQYLPALTTWNNIIKLNNKVISKI
jgi:hypothetical protein